MSKEYGLVGKDIHPELEKAVREEIDRKKEVGAKILEGETKKTQKQLKLIELVNLYLQDEFKKLGIATIAPFPPHRFHFLKPTVFAQHFPNHKTVAFYKSLPEDGIYVYDDTFEGWDELDICSTIIHETIHALSHQKYFASLKEQSLKQYRVGYGIEHPKDKHSHFDGFVEAITTKLENELYHKHEEELVSELKLEPKGIPKVLDIYDYYVETIGVIIGKVAEIKNENPEKVWERFKRGLFTGEMMHLRDIERAFGNESLRVLAALGISKDNEENEQLAILVRDYFETNDFNLKSSIVATLKHKWPENFRANKDMFEKL
jgi:hypothetical protein